MPRLGAALTPGRRRWPLPSKAGILRPMANVVPLSLSVHELATLRRVAAPVVPSFDSRFDREVEVRLLNQPWFERHRLLEVASPSPLPARRAHFAVGDHATLCLSGATPGKHGHVQLDRLLDADPPAPIDTAQRALDYAVFVDFVTCRSELGELILSRFEDIPLFPQLDDIESALMSGLQEDLDGAIRPPDVQPAEGGWVVEKWVLTAGALLRRECYVGTDGRFRTEETVIDESMPVPHGRVWGFSNGRLVPVG